MRYLFSILILISSVLIPVSCDLIVSEKVYRNGAIVCSDRTAGDVGLRMLKNGGNAIDAACATALALAVTYPLAGNIGGGGFALVYLADSQKIFSLDFRETAPGLSATEKYLDSKGKVDRDKALFGPLAAGTPGTVAGLFELHRRFGSLAWPDLVHPAGSLAANGFIIEDYLASAFVEYADKLARFPATEAIFLPGGIAPKAGDRLVQVDLAHTLGLIETDGRDGFYLGETAEKITAFCSENGGTISLDDLRDYVPVWREPVHFRFRNLDVYASGLPSSGGIVMGQILRILEQHELERYTADSPEYIHLFTEAARLAFADREEYLGDPDFTEDLSAELLDDNYIKTRIKSIDAVRASLSSDIFPGMPKKSHESDQTTHLITADSQGNVVSVTYTINDWFGCKAVVPGCGFLLNNEMDDFAIMPGSPNSFGLIGGEPNKIEPGKRMLSSMTPTIVMKGKRPYLAVGSPGGSKIITAVAQTIINRHVYGMKLGKAVNMPRFHHQWMPDKLFLEQGGYDINIIQSLISKGHNVVERKRYGEMMALEILPDGVHMIGGADRRRGGGCTVGY